MTGKRLLLGAVLLTALLTAGWFISKSKSWQHSGEIAYKLETAEKIIALTFDDGPSPDETDTVLQILDDAGIKATFYLNGDQMTLHREAAPKIVAAGHELGNHGFTHRRMVLRTPSDLRASLERTDALIRDAGYTGPITFRPPFGQKLVSLPLILDELGMINVMWSIDPMQAMGWSASGAEFASHTIDVAEPGDIILLHPMFKANVEVRNALPDLIAGLQAKGFEFVTISDLLSRNR